MELFKSRTRVAYTNAVGDKVYPVIVDIKRGIKSTEEIQFMSSDINTGVLSVAFIQGNEDYNVSGAEVVCSVMRPDASTLDIPCTIVENNIVEVPLGINGTSQDGIYSFDFKVFKGGNKVVGTPIMNYSVSLSISNDNAVLEDDRLPVLTMLMTQVTELKDEAREAIKQANTATEASREATANAVEATNNANAVSERVSQETATAISEIKQDTENAITNMNQSTSSAISTMNQSTNDAIASMNQSTTEAVSSMTQNTANAIADMTQKTDEAVTRVNDNLANINNVVTTKVVELDTAKSDMTATVSNKVNEVETRFNALTSKQQQDAEVIDARDGETSLKARLDRDIEKAKQVYVNVEGSNISTDSSSGYAKDVEILGNTIQDASNLADIRSVGDKVEGQELYEIPVLSVGKNLVDNSKHYIIDMGHSTQRYVTINNGGHTSSSAIFYLKQGTYSFAIEGFNLSKVVDGGILVWKKDKLYSNTRRVAISKPFSIEDDEIGITFYFATETMQETLLLHNKPFMIEEGTQATPYEPYIEDKLTILSPVQLEKVGDVRDRIIEKDGVWGVEKNIGAVVFNGSESITHIETRTNTTTFNIPYNMQVKDSALVSNLFNWEHTYNDYEHIYSLFDSVFRVLISNDKANNIDDFKQYLSSNNLEVKYICKMPQFIPLPHDQQIKLRTFANKTNISFLTEIEGTIKAQVPKSIGATVNTHTEQIRSLNNELNRVKKLEESTVSTVTTESDFTTVEATSNGYFEDVKLEGKTLVNLFNFKSLDIINEVNIYVSAKNYELTKGKEVTLVNNTDKAVIYDINKDSSWVRSYTLNANTCIKATLKEGEFINCCYGAGVKGWDANSESDKEKLKKTCIVLEGDHTQNPPTYFEGLKSVGQSASEDGADEIVVSSVNENLFSLDGFSYNQFIRCEDNKIVLSGLTSGTTYVRKLLKLKPNTKYTITLKAEGNQGAVLRASVDKNATWHNDLVSMSFDRTKQTFTTPADGVINIGFVCDANKTTTVWDIKLEECSVEAEYTPHQSDKKRLLFYNNETQAWEKPILREWDSIEKHADGKYYYHQRSGEVVLNGSENGWIANSNVNGVYRYELKLNPTGLKLGKIISNKFIWKNNGLDENDAWLHGESGALCIRSLIDNVQGFKQWLQANNVTVVYQLAQEKVYECTNIDLITYANETNYVVESGVIVPRTTLKVHNNISNVVSLLQKKVSILESNIKASQEVQDMMILETDMRMLEIELALMEFAPMTLNLGGSNMLRSATYFNFLKNHIINGTYEKEYLENVMNKYLATGRINQDEYDELYKMLYPPVYDIELPIEL